MDLKQAIIAHLDPLKNFDTQKASSRERIEFTKYISRHSISLDAEPLSEEDVNLLEIFLKTLEFEVDDR